jgi:SAM-dependent methyltransferase
MGQPKKCLLCNAGSDFLSLIPVEVYEGEGQHKIHHCRKCDVRFLYPGLNAEDEKRFYANEFEKFMVKRSATDAGWEKPDAHVAANQAQVIRRMSYLDKLLPKPKTARILEVGCSSGFLMFPLAEKGHECIGIEPSGVFSDFVRHKGLACYQDLKDMYEDELATNGFDIIMHFYVLEHIKKPGQFLMEQFQLLNPGGHLVFEVPHALDALHSVYNIPEYDRFIWVVSHRWYFTESSLNLLLNRIAPDACINIFQDQRYDLSNHIVWARDGKPGGLERYTAVIGQEIEDLYRQSLINAGRGDTLIAIVQKPFN